MTEFIGLALFAGGRRGSRADVGIGIRMLCVSVLPARGLGVRFDLGNAGQDDRRAVRARIDGSASWTIGILGSSALFAGPYLPAATARRIYAKGVLPMAGSFLPKGQAEPVAGGYRVNGRWLFASGIHHANWVLAGVPIRYSSPRSFSSNLTHDNVLYHA